MMTVSTTENAIDSEGGRSHGVHAQSVGGGGGTAVGGWVAGGGGTLAVIPLDDRDLAQNTGRDG